MDGDTSDAVECHYCRCTGRGVAVVIAANARSAELVCELHARLRERLGAELLWLIIGG